MSLFKKKKTLLTYQKKLIISYILFSFVPVLIIGTFSYINSYKMMKEGVESNIQGTLSQIEDNIKYKQKILEGVSDIIYADQELQQRFASSSDYDKYEMTKTVQWIIDRGNLFQTVEKDIRLSIYTDNQNIPEVYYLNPLKDDEDLDPNNFNIYQLSRIENKTWYKNLSKKGNELSWEIIERKDKNQVISLVRNQVDFKRLTNIGIIRIDVNVKHLFSAVDYNKIGSNSSLIVLDNNNQILYQSLSKRDEITREIIEDNRYLISEHHINNTPWKLIALIPKKDLFENAKSMLYITFLICFIILIISILFSIFLSKALSSNIKKIIYGINMLENGHFSFRVEEKVDDEFKQIMITLNKMAMTIETLINEVYVTSLKRKEIELQLLQAQINPHFLYNTLSSISRLAKLGKIEELHLMILALAKFYRLALNEGRMIISIEKEVEQIKAYIIIQSIQFGNRLKVSYDFDDEIMRFDTIKFILQPFIENILEHAWHQDTMIIRIKGYKIEENIYLEITDNGIGMTEELLEQVLLDDDSRKGYGIYNVENRIKLQFGDDYGVRINSVLGNGTKIQLTIPCYKEQQKDE